jgi:hypothetical protein
MHNKKMAAVAICIAAFAMSAAAQTVTGSGTAGTVPVFTGSGTSSTIGNSSAPITVSSSGNVGIGTTNPGTSLDVNGLIRASFGTGSLGTYLMPRGGSGNGYRMGVGNNLYWNGSNWLTNSDGSNSGGTAIISGYYPANMTFYTVPSSGSAQTISNAAFASYARMTILESGNVGIGTTAPAYNLDVTGTIRATTGVVFPDGTTQVTAFLPANCGADYAEAVDVSGDRTKYEPGDVLVIDPSAPGKFLKSNQAYSTLVAGIYSTRPGYVGRLHPEDAKTKEIEVPMAMVGRVPTKVSAENGPIKVGDLLVASSRLGYAMKGTDRSLMLGAVVGKALGSLDSGTGVIEVLVTLQ